MFDDPRDVIPESQLEALNLAFAELLRGCLEEAARGRKGLFGTLAGDADYEWPEAERLRALAMSMQQILAQSDEQNLLCDEFLDLCSIHGESNPGEAALARAFLARIDRNEVGKQGEEEKNRW